MMNGVYKDRAEILGEFIVDTGATVRAAGKKFGVSKSTVHKDVTERLKKQSPALFLQVKQFVIFAWQAIEVYIIKLGVVAIFVN